MKRIVLIAALLVGFQSISKAQSWQACNLSPNSNSTSGTSLCVHQGKLFATSSVGGLFVSTDLGQTWNLVNASILSPQVNLYSTGDRLYALLHNSGCTYIQYSTDEGITFQLDSEGLPSCYDGAVTQPSTLGKAWDGHLIMSLSGPDWEFSRNTAEAAWTDVSYFDENDCSEFFIKNDTCWAATNGATSNGVAWSVNGVDWTSPPCVGISNFYVAGNMAWSDQRLFLAGISGDTILKYSDDYGQSFQDINIQPYLDGYAFFSQTGYQPINDMFAGYGSLFLCLGNDALESAPELLMSSDGGMSFTRDTLGFPTNVLGSNFTINDMAFLNGWAFAQVNSGDVYRRQITVTGLEETKNARLMQVYPNPTSNVIRWDSPADAKVFDMQGRQVLQANGTSLSLQELEDGIYWVRLARENEISTEFFKIVKAGNSSVQPTH
jgi:hypothetical protein